MSNFLQYYMSEDKKQTRWYGPDDDSIYEEYEESDEEYEESDY